METDNTALWATMLNNKGCENAWLNNPFLYLIFLAMFGGGNFFGNRSGAQSAAETAGLSQQMSDNHNNDLVMGAIRGNADAINSLASKLNCDGNALGAAIASLRSSADLGFANLGSTFQNCCCQNGKDTMKMGYENQISNLQQTNTLMGRIDQLANGVQQGFSSIGYATAQQTCDLKTNQNENTQRIIDTMNNHWTSDLSQRYQDARLEMSQLKQTAELISALKTTA